MWPGNYDPEVPDLIHEITDAEAFHYTRRLAAEEGFLPWLSGMALAAALKEAKDHRRYHVMVVILLDLTRWLGQNLSET